LSKLSPKIDKTPEFAENEATTAIDVLLKGNDEVLEVCAIAQQGAEIGRMNRRFPK